MTLALTLFSSRAETSGSIGSYSLSPVPGSYETLSTIKFTFPNTGLMGIADPKTEGITLTMQNDPSVVYTVSKCDYDLENYATLHFSLPGTAEEGIQSPGTYTLYVPEGAFSKYRDDTKTNAPISATYIVTKGTGTIEPPQPVDPFKIIETTPADGSRNGSLSAFSITFPDLNEGLAYPFTTDKKMTLKREGDEQIYEMDAIEVKGPDYRTIIFGFDKPGTPDSRRLEFTEAGIYTLTVPAGIFAEEGHPEIVNPEFILTYTVDPTLNFSCTITPDNKPVYASISDFTVTAGSNLASIGINPDSEVKATLSLDEAAIILAAQSKDEKNIVLGLPAGFLLPEGDWTLNIPAGYLSGVLNEDNLTLFNTDAINLVYKIRKPMTFDYTLTPVDGADVELLKKITIAFAGTGLSKAGINAEAGPAMLSGGTLNEPVALTGRVSGKSVELVVTDPIGDGEYTVSVPDGYIFTTDTNKLTSDIKGFSCKYSVTKPEVPDFTTGMLMLNEGWFGHDNGSVNFIGKDGKVTYNAFKLQNPGLELGTTTESGSLYGNTVFAVSKQATGGPFLAAMDATTLNLKGSISEIPYDGKKKPQAYAFQAVSEEKGYLSTNVGLFIVDLKSWTVTKQLTADWITDGYAFGDMQRYGEYVYVTSQMEGIIAVNVNDDTPVLVDVPTAAALFVTGTGSLYAATLDESNEFVRIDTENQEENISFDIEEDKSKIQSPWGTWRMSSIAGDRDKDIVYFVKAGTSRIISRYDFGTKEYTQDFITLPGKEDGLEADLIIYGQGISVDPSSGHLIVNVTEAGYGSHYEVNRILHYNTVTGEEIPDATVILDPYYWFPSQMLYPGFSAPEITLEPMEFIAVDDEPVDFEVELNLPDITRLATGNSHLIIYSASLNGDNIGSLTATYNGVYKLKIDNFGEASLSLCADYQGKKSVKDVPVSVKHQQGTPEICLSKTRDVYTTTGILIIRNGTDEEILGLNPGLYIIQGKKVLIK